MKQSSLTKVEKDFFMREAIKEAKLSEEKAEVPIGAIVVLNGTIIGRGHNLRESSQDATAHAELVAIKKACQTIDSWRLEGAQLFATLEPCPMCSGAIQQSRIEEVYFGAWDKKAGACGSLVDLLHDERFNHWCYVEGDLLKEECADLLTEFFRDIRKRQKKAKKNKQKLELGGPDV